MERSGPRDPELVRTRLASWLRDALPATGEISISGLDRPETSGFSNETLLFDAAWDEGATRREKRLVLRLAPTNYQVFLEPKFAEQYRIMQVLAERTDVPVPPLYGYEPDPGLFGVPFFVMGAIEGRVPTDVPSYHAEGWVHDLSPAERERLWWTGVETLAKVHSLDADALGIGFLDDPKRGRTGLDQQLSYYADMLTWSAAGQPPPHLMATTLDWLRAEAPAEPDRPGLVWGDARLGNIMFGADCTATAVLDWEMAALGQPEIDFAWFLFMDRHHSEGFGLPRLPGFPSREETVARYESLLGRPVRNLHYYEVFAAFRMSLVMYRIGLMMIELGWRPADDAPVNNSASRLLAKMLDLPAPGPATVSA